MTKKELEKIKKDLGELMYAVRELQLEQSHIRSHWEVDSTKNNALFSNMNLRLKGLEAHRS